MDAFAAPARSREAGVDDRQVIARLDLGVIAARLQLYREELDFPSGSLIKPR